MAGCGPGLRGSETTVPHQRLKADVIGCFDVGEGVEERTKEDS